MIVALDTEMTLEALGYRVTTVHTLTGARAALARGDLDLALLDINLGQGERSLELGRLLIAQGVHVVFASGYNRADIAAELTGPLARAGYVEKPLDERRLGLALSAPAAIAAQ